MQADKDHLHLYISAAQRALLNPQTPTEDFVQQADDAVSEARSGRSSSSLDSGTEDTLAFTRNVIVLEITGADADLTLIDLPGIIQTEVNRDGSVELVKGLVQQYIRSDRAIIVATISCKDEIKNQVRVMIARHCVALVALQSGPLTRCLQCKSELDDKHQITRMVIGRYHL